MSRAIHRPVTILAVEDDMVDAEMLKRALKKAEIDVPVQHAESGVEALEILRGENNREKLSSPLILLVDINMPLMNGLEMLEHIRQDDSLSHNIAFILTTSALEQDKAASYKLNVAGYFLKENFGELIETLRHYCQANQFPSYAETDSRAVI